MRDVRRIQERMDVRLDRAQVVWLTLGVTVLLAVSFALGMIAGRRAERLAIASAPSPASDPMAAVERATDEHEALTFYRELKDEPKSEPITTVALAPSPPPEEPEKPRPEARREVRKKSSKKTSDVRIKLDTGPANQGQYTVQVSAFQSMEEARAFAASLERKGYAPFITSVSLPHKGTWYRVRLGAFDNELEATLAKQILARKDIPAWVLKTE